ncbi:MAG TPA: hypothetical protein VGD43_20195 [Micromonospora sp.]
MRQHDEPNEYGFAGEATAPEPPPRNRRDPLDEEEAVAVPGSDITTELGEAFGEMRGHPGREPDSDDVPPDR